MIPAFKYTPKHPKIKPLFLNSNSGMSIIEMLVVTVMIALLVLMAIFTYQRQVAKARDAERKDDLERLRVAFEDYYNDKGCYPAAAVVLSCNQDVFSPYINEIPCDPLTGEPYKFFSPNSNTCRGFKLLTNLENDDDPAIERVGCDFELGCGWGEHPEYNYGIAVGDGMLSDNWMEGGEPLDIDLMVDRYYCIPQCGEPMGCHSPEDYYFSCSSISYESALNYYHCSRSYDSADGCDSECEDRIDEDTGDPISAEEWENTVSCEIPD